MRGSPWAGTGRNVGFLADRQGFRALFDKTIPLARQLRVCGGKNWESQGMDHEVSWIAGEEQTLARMVTGIMWPRWQTGHSRREWPVSLSYRSR
jgi:hypothetical protein